MTPLMGVEMALLGQGAGKGKGKGKGKLGLSWAIWGPSWAALGPSWAILGSTWAILGLSWAILRPDVAQDEKMIARVPALVHMWVCQPSWPQEGPMRNVTTWVPMCANTLTTHVPM